MSCAEMHRELCRTVCPASVLRRSRCPARACPAQKCIVNCAGQCVLQGVLRRSRCPAWACPAQECIVICARQCVLQGVLRMSRCPAWACPAQECIVDCAGQRDKGKFKSSVYCFLRGLLFYHHPSRWRPLTETINAAPHFPSRRKNVLQFPCSRQCRFGLVRDLLG